MASSSIPMFFVIMRSFLRQRSCVCTPKTAHRCLKLRNSAGLRGFNKQPALCNVFRISLSFRRNQNRLAHSVQKFLVRGGDCGERAA